MEEIRIVIKKHFVSRKVKAKALRTMDVITDPSYSRNMDPDMALGSNLGLDITMAPAAARPSDTNMVSSSCPDSGISTAPCGYRNHGHQLRPWMLLGHRLRHGPW
ncbi:hypothetical protein STEG23_026338 [Scotinomys teguina]